MIESELVRTKKIGVCIGGKTIKLTFAHYMINMIFWNIIVKVGDTIKPEHLFFDNCIPGRTIENYINKLIIGPYREIIPLKLQQYLPFTVLKPFLILSANSAGIFT